MKTAGPCILSALFRSYQTICKGNKTPPIVWSEYCLVRRGQCNVIAEYATLCEKTRSSASRCVFGMRITEMSTRVSCMYTRTHTRSQTGTHEYTPRHSEHGHLAHAVSTYFLLSLISGELSVFGFSYIFIRKFAPVN